MQVLSDRIVVEPYFDSDKLGSIIIPASFQNPEAQQGKVVAAGPLSYWGPGDYLVFHPFRSEPWPGNDQLVSIRATDVVCQLLNGELVPKQGTLRVRPDWDSKLGQTTGSKIFLPPTVKEDNSPVLFGTIEYGYGEEYPVGARIAMQPGAGSEASLGLDLFYFIDHKDVMAIIHG